MAILEVRSLKKYFPVTGGVFLRRTGWIYALDDVSFELEKGKTLGIVGESGCGKTTLGRCIMGLYKPTAGQVIVNNRQVSNLKAQQRKKLALDLQMIFQDPFESLNPRQTIRQILEEKFIIHGTAGNDLDDQLTILLERSGLHPEVLAKFPHEFSGGQRQRIGIARAISMNPKIIICDEPVSALDVSVQSKILNLLLDLQRELDLTYIFISHDLSVVRHISDTIAVMYMGKIVEMGEAGMVYKKAFHPYTRALLSAIPVPDPEVCSSQIVLSGEIPSVEHPPAGCRFNTRCIHKKQICEQEEPILRNNEDDPDHATACHFFY